MIEIEIIFALIAVSSLFMSIVVFIVSYLKQREATRYQKELLNRALAYTKVETFNVVAELLEKRVDAFREAEKELRRTLKEEPWFIDLSEIVRIKRKREGDL